MILAQMFSRLNIIPHLARRDAEGGRNCGIVEVQSRTSARQTEAYRLDSETTRGYARRRPVIQREAPLQMADSQIITPTLLLFDPMAAITPPWLFCHISAWLA